MIDGARYLHTNLIAADWARLARFYVELFGCQLVPPERDLAGEAFERGAGLPGARARGAHLRLPGGGDDGPTLEIFQYAELAPETPRPVNRPGFAHIAFAVTSVAEARAQVLAAGGAPVGELVTTVIASGDRITWCYVTDPEGNIVELQSVTRAV
jgi:catechol 2,3-dioxygenase-like lactoylglutathione lyase family enzyme